MLSKITFCSLACFWCLTLPAQTSFLKIHLLGYDETLHKNFAEITLPDWHDPIHKQIKITEEGLIQSDLLIFATREVILSYDGTTVSLLVAPGDRVAVELFISDLLISKVNRCGSVSGRLSSANTLIFNHTAWLDSLIDLSSQIAVKNGLNDADYKAARLNQMNAHFTFLNNLIERENITHQLFIQWAESKIKYAAGFDLCTVPFRGKLNQTLSDQDAYFSFIPTLFPEDEFVAYTQCHLQYLTFLMSSFEIIAGISTTYAPKREKLKQEGQSMFPLKFEMIRRHLKDIQLSMAIEQLNRSSKQIPPEYMDSLSIYPTAAFWTQPDRVDSTIQIPIWELLKDFELKSSEKDPLLTLYQNAKGKVILHTFWFTNCAPCMRELPHYNSLIQQAGASYEFIFYGVYMEEQEWRATVEKYNLKGTHLLLSKNQIAFYEKYFGVYGFPHHELTNKAGRIVKPSVSPMISDNFLHILSRLGDAASD